jgi:acyl dehydratase
MNPTLHPVTLTVDQAAIQAYAQITDDFNPIHVDPEFAATTPMGRVIAHGMLSANLIIQSIALTFGTARASRTTLDIRFARPVFAGDVVEAGGTEDTPGAGQFSVWVRKQDGTIVIEGSAVIPPRA